jgi:hypothetical protein
LAELLMPDLTRQEAIASIKRAVSDAHWAGLTAQEITAVFTAAVLEKFG